MPNGDIIDAIALVQGAADEASPITSADVAAPVEKLLAELETRRTETAEDADAKVSARGLPVRYNGMIPDPTGLATVTRDIALAGLPDVIAHVTAEFHPAGQDGRGHFGPTQAEELMGGPLVGKGPCNMVAWINSNNPFFELKLIQEFDPLGIFWWVQVRDRETGVIVAEARDELLGNNAWGLRGAAECEACINSILSHFATWTASLIA
jgi:hypothetical protein